ncbi:MAG: tRNA (adenosine(37)-N6)-threonylcarbamoyltransferase complex transferase subunit TsaD [Actinomycetota bacterium]|nr:tRNA (adenosine(37)-N6)-threonylcarbamoyltransferase complex transferase subunit TsaD [Actinomycetota bacterium]
MDLLLGIETSCDDTAVAVVGADGKVLSSVIASQIAIHSDFGGVVPELASRAHDAVIVPTLEEALRRADLSIASPGLDAIAVTVGPGLSGPLMVGVATAQALSVAWNVPLIAVNHLEGHIFALGLDATFPKLPLVVLVVSGGHTMIVGIRELGVYEILGRSYDDAAGEAFDKVARLLGLGFPGGPEIERLGNSGDREAIKFKQAVTKGRFDFSFSGPKTAVVRYLKDNPGFDASDVAASFQESIAQVLARKTIQAAIEYGANSIGLSGGVGANTRLRELLMDLGDKNSIEVFLPARSNCTDNGAMIAEAGRFRLEKFGPTSLPIDVVPSLRFG